MNNTLILRGGESLARDTRTVFELLEKLQGGLLEVRLPDGSSALFGDGEAAYAIATLAVTFAILVFSEITPKVIGAAHADRIVSHIASDDFYRGYYKKLSATAALLEDKVKLLKPPRRELPSAVLARVVSPLSHEADRTAVSAIANVPTGCPC